MGRTPLSLSPLAPPFPPLKNKHHHHHHNNNNLPQTNPLPTPVFWAGFERRGLTHKILSERARESERERVARHKESGKRREAARVLLSCSLLLPPPSPSRCVFLKHFFPRLL